MITKQDLMEAIAECQGVRNPTSSTAIKLAAFYTILDHLEDDGNNKQDVVTFPSYSYANEPSEEIVTYESDSDFSRAIQGMETNEVLAIMDELMSTLQAVNPRLYNGVMRKF